MAAGREAGGATAGGWQYIAVVHAVCGIDGDPAPKNNPKAEYVLEGRPYYAEFDDDS